MKILKASVNNVHRRICLPNPLLLKVVNFKKCLYQPVSDIPGAKGCKISVHVWFVQLATRELRQNKQIAALSKSDAYLSRHHENAHLDKVPQTLLRS